MRTLMAAQVLIWRWPCQEFHLANGRFQLTPLWLSYDIKLVMAMLGKNRDYEMHGIQCRHSTTLRRRSAMP